MESGVKILIERLKTNPEEFMERNNRWMNLVLKYREFMSAEDRVTLDEALRPVLMERFNEEVLNTLMIDEEDWNPFGVTPVKREGSAVEYKWVAEKPTGTITYKTKGRYKTP